MTDHGPAVTWTYHRTHSAACWRWHQQCAASEVERLKGALAEVLHEFVDAAIAGGQPILRTGWIPEATLDRWHHALGETTTPPGAPDLDAEPPAATTPTPD